MNQSFRISKSYFVAISVSGFGIGFLVGLSASPVVNALLAGILSLVAAVVGALCGIRIEKSKPEPKLGQDPDAENKDQGSQLEWDTFPFAARVSPLPMAFLVIAIVAGSLVGLYARTHEWFAETPAHLVKKWQKSTDLSPEDIARRLFDSMYGTAKPEAKSEEPNNLKAISFLIGALAKSEEANTGAAASPHAGVLFAYSSAQLASLDPSRLRDSAAVSDLYTRTGGLWAALAKSVNETSIDEAQRMKLFTAFWNEMKNNENSVR
jgi:hypothetical protein